MSTQPLQPGDLVQLAGWPSPIALEVVEVIGNHVVLLAGNLRITAHRSTVSSVHQPCRT